jgi:hypothetical protein
VIHYFGYIFSVWERGEGDKKKFQMVEKFLENLKKNTGVITKCKNPIKITHFSSKSFENNFNNFQW